MLLFLDTIYSAISKNEVVDVIHTDFEKTFDKVDHGILIDKLYSLGIRGKILKLIHNYLTNRTQCVKIKDCLSQLFYVTSGVPQGSILGPLFFLVMINGETDFILHGNYPPGDILHHYPPFLKQGLFPPFLSPNFMKLDVHGQLHEKDGSCATSGSKVMTRAVNKLKMRSKTDEVASVGLKINKACS